MKYFDPIKHRQEQLNQQYKSLVEQAYNFRQTDSALSDISEYRAIKLLNKLNKLNYLCRD